MSTRRLFDCYVACLVCLAMAPGIARAAPPAASEAPDKEDALSRYRERFKLGMQRYAAGAIADAIGFWAPIYGELGTERGYRLAYDLGVAYAELGQAAPAAERLGEFLAEVDRRRAHGEALAAIVQKEETDARARIEGLRAAKGPVGIDAGTPPGSVGVDATEPRPSTPEPAHDEAAHVDPRDERSPLEQAPKATNATVSIDLPRRPELGGFIRHEVQRPFPLAIVAASGGLALGGAAAAVPLLNHAWALRNRFANERPSIPAMDRQSFDAARTSAYAAVGVATALGMVTGALTAWYFLGASGRDVVVLPSGGLVPDGATAGIAGRF